MTVQHRINDQLAMGYAAGILPEAFELVVATHLSICDESRAKVASFEALGGSVLETTPTARLNQSCFAKTMQKIKNPAPTKHSRHTPCPVIPGPLQEYIGGDLNAIKWKSMGKGIKQCVLDTSKDATARLFYIPAGVAVPDHGHRGTELTLVLQGAFADEQDRFARGDIEIADEEMEHTPIAEQGQDCICLAATDAPLRFSSLPYRLMQPFFKI